MRQQQQQQQRAMQDQMRRQQQQQMRDQQQRQQREQMRRQQQKAQQMQQKRQRDLQQKNQLRNQQKKQQQGQKQQAQQRQQKSLQKQEVDQQRKNQLRNQQQVNNKRLQQQAAQKAISQQLKNQKTTIQNQQKQRDIKNKLQKIKTDQKNKRLAQDKKTKADKAKKTKQHTDALIKAQQQQKLSQQSQAEAKALEKTLRQKTLVKTQQDNLVKAKLAKLKTASKPTGCCCFSPETLVLTETGARSIVSLKVGENVFAKDIKTGDVSLKPITQTIVTENKPLYHVTILTHDNNSEIFKVTDNHPFWTQQYGWVDVAELKEGMMLTTYEEQTSVVQSIIQTSIIENTYNITVADYHTYFAGVNNTLVHNCDNTCYTITKSSADLKKLKTTALGGVAKSRINLSNITLDNGRKRGLEYALNKHGQNSKFTTKSKFLISDDEVKKMLAIKEVAKVPLYQLRAADGSNQKNKFVRQVDAGKVIGVNKRGQEVKTFTVITDGKGNLINTFPGKLR